MLGLRRITKRKQGLFRLSKLLLAKDMERNLAKERERCDRYFLHFSLIVVRTPEESFDKWAPYLDRYLEERLRLSDDAGFLRRGGVGIVLPMTSLEGAQKVLDDLHQLARSLDIEIETEVFTYSGHDGQGPGLGPHFDTSDKARESDFSSDREDPRSGGENTVLRRVSPEHIHASFGDGSEVEYAQSGGSQATLCAEPAVKAVAPVRGHREEAMLEYCSTPFPKWKRGLDLAGALLGLAATLPVIVIAGIAIKLTSRGPIFFKQMRCGQFGRPFAIYKLRTMVVDAEELKGALQERNERDGPAFKLSNDPRVTKVGNFLRKVGADELPQLVNVLMGDMSIVGPRPLPIAEDMQCASWQRKRLDTKPGLTCTWQIGKSRKMSFQEWMRLDRQYAEDRGILTDTKLVLKTVGAVFLGRVGH